MELIVVFAECDHGAIVQRVAVRQAGAEWTVEARYGCDAACTETETSAEMPANVVDTQGRVLWSAP